MNQEAVMIDLETLALSPRAGVVAIGAVSFRLDSEGTNSAFYKVISQDSNNALGRKVDRTVQLWWKSQPEDVQAILTDTNAIRLNLALLELREWFPQGATVWGNGSDFDIAKLDDAYTEAGITSPWEFYNVRDLRTVKNLPGMEDVPAPPNPHAHNALEDALCQAQHLQALYKKLTDLRLNTVTL